MADNPSKKSKSNKSNSPAPAEAQENRTLLGQILVELGYITVYQLDESLQVQRSEAAGGSEQKPLGQILLELGYCSPNQLIRAIQVQSDYRKAAARLNHN